VVWVVVVPAAAFAALLALWLVGERGHLLLPSTRRALRERRTSPRGGLLNALHGYVYGRWTYEYIAFVSKWLAPRLGPGLRRTWADHYHGKVLPTELARRIVRVDCVIPRTDLERIIPYPAARDIVLSANPDITLFDCPCRAAREHPCEPIRVCMIVGGGDFTRDHHPGRAHRATREEALALLDAEHARGHVHTAYFKDACDHRFYAICNCCRCCCGGLKAMLDHGIPMVASSGFVAQVDADLCNACGECGTACPFGAVAVDGQATVDWERCFGCGVCEGRCPIGAIALVEDARKGLPLDVHRPPRPSTDARPAPGAKKAPLIAGPSRSHLRAGPRPVVLRLRGHHWCRRRLVRTAEALARRDGLRAHPQTTLVPGHYAGPNRTLRVPRSGLERRVPLRVVRHGEPPPRAFRHRGPLLGRATIRATALLERECAQHRCYAETLVTFSAAGPFWPCTMSNCTASPSTSDLKPLPAIAE
jgi:Pyruvate/2-oxoacid:ferredoxin oxidoreductase delta subunit